jgi:Tol biopolymer transport system component
MAIRGFIAATLVTFGGAIPAAAWAQAARGFDLYVLDTQTGQVTQATNTPEVDEYNATFSPDGRSLIHDMVYWTGPSLFLDLGVTRISSGHTRELYIPYWVDNGVWSPDGDYIAYETVFDSVEVMDAESRVVVYRRAGASWPSWSPDSHHIAFRDSASGAITTATLRGVETSLAVAGAIGCSPHWSPKGNLIVFVRDCTGTVLSLVPVTRRGAATGNAYAVTAGDHFASVPHISPDGQRILYSGTLADPGQFGIYTVSVFGGAPVVLHDVPGKPAYDPSWSPDGHHVVFSSQAFP